MGKITGLIPSPEWAPAPVKEPVPAAVPEIPEAPANEENAKPETVKPKKSAKTK